MNPERQQKFPLKCATADNDALNEKQYKMKSFIHEKCFART